MTQPDQVLCQIISKIEALNLQGHKSLAVFDLDSTLFDVSLRTERILREYSQDPEFLSLFPHLKEVFETVTAQHGDWGIKDALIRARIHEIEPTVGPKLMKFWMDRFFTNEYLSYDKPYEGAVEYVQALSQLGADVVYLTGRDQHRMGIGSRDILLKWGFPLDDQQSVLVLKPHRSMDDGEFKSSWFLQDDLKKYSYITFFENEPVNVNRVMQKTPHVEIIFFDSTHSGKEQVSKALTMIKNYRRQQGQV